jgi:hypothetical protein
MDELDSKESLLAYPHEEGSCKEAIRWRQESKGRVLESVCLADVVGAEGGIGHIVISVIVCMLYAVRLTRSCLPYKRGRRAVNE